MTLKRLVVVGAGAIGGSVGGLLADTNHPVALIARGAHGAAIRKDGLRVRLPDRTVVASTHCVSRVDELNWSDGDVVMFATKLNDARAVMEEVANIVGSEIPVVCATNGMHGEQWAKELFSNVVSMMVWMPTTHLDPGEVRIHSPKVPGVLDNGPVCGGQAAAVSDALSSWLSAATFSAVSRPDITAWKRAKWITNLGNTAQALVTDDWRQVAKLAQQEGENVLQASGLARVPVSELLDHVAVVQEEPIDGTTREGGSTWQSLKRGKPLESPWLEGAMADLGDQLGIPAPVNRFLATTSLNPRPLLAEEVLAAR